MLCNQTRLAQSKATLSLLPALNSPAVVVAIAIAIVLAIAPVGGITNRTNEDISTTLEPVCEN
jgi:hypothetical protein